MPTTPDLTQLNLNLLRSFCAIADERGISSAARRLSLSQPSLSLALRRLEESLGCRLVHRDSRRFVLTIEVTVRRDRYPFQRHGIRSSTLVIL